MNVTWVTENDQFEDSILQKFVENSIKKGYKAVYTVTCLTCGTQFITGRMPPMCPNEKCPEHKAQQSPAEAQP